ncbi:reverse transcriptase domain-containing protein [Tanacetum coccineum]
MKRYGVNHQFSTSYHPQTSGQVEDTDGALKRILEKTIKDNPSIWSRKLDDALWAFRTTYKTPTGTTPYKLVYGKNCHLPFEIEQRAYWALKKCNPDLIDAGEKRMFQLHELEKFRHQAYENSRLYKARTKVWQDMKLKMRKEFKHGNKANMQHLKTLKNSRPLPNFEKYAIDTPYMILWLKIKKITFSANTPYPKTPISRIGQYSVSKKSDMAYWSIRHGKDILVGRLWTSLAGLKLMFINAAVFVNEPKLEDIPVVRELPGVFSEDLLRLPPSREVEFCIDLIPGAMHVPKSPYHLAPTEMQELSNQLKELQEKVQKEQEVHRKLILMDVAMKTRNCSSEKCLEINKELEALKTPTDIYSFLGLAGYYRRFIANFLKIEKPLTPLTQKNKKLKWGDE